MDQTDTLIEDLRNPKQLELFHDPDGEAVRRVIVALWDNREKIHRMHEVMEKVLAGEPGYAAKPKRNVARKRKAE